MRSRTIESALTLPHGVSTSRRSLQSAPSVTRRTVTTTGRILPSGARLALPSSSSASSLSRRPLFFPLGATVGFLVGFSVAGLLGYARLIEWHSRTNAGLEAGLTDLESRVKEVNHSLDQLETVREYQANSVKAQKDTTRLQQTLNEATRVQQRLEQRIIGLEEDGIALRRRIHRLGELSEGWTAHFDVFRCCECQEY